jgi:hypothetical protein
VVNGLSVHDRTAPDKAGYIDMDRCAINLGGRSHLQQSSTIEHRDAIGQRQRLALVVGHIDNGRAGGTVDVAERIQHCGTQMNVEIGQRLVEQDYACIGHNASGKRHTLPLSARKLVNFACSESGKPDHGEHIRNLLLDGSLVQPARPQRVGDVAGNIHMRPQGIGLEDHADAALFRRHLPHRVGDHQVPEADAARVRRLEAGDQPEQRGLAAAGGAEQRGERAGRKVERNTVQRLDRTEAARNISNAYLAHAHSCRQVTRGFILEGRKRRMRKSIVECRAPFRMLL